MGFFEDYWLEMLSITFSVVAMAVSLYSLYLKRAELQKERFAREVSFGPMDEVILVDREAIENRDEVPVQLINETGIPQVVNGLWVQIEQYPKEITEEQYVRFKALLVALMQAGLRTLGENLDDQRLREEGRRGTMGNRTLFLVALMILIVNRIRQDDTKDLVVDQRLVSALQATSGSLDDMVEVLEDPKHDWVVRKLLTPQAIEMLEEHVRSIMSENGYPLYRSMKLEVYPSQIKDVDLHLMRFAERLYDRLDLVGGQFDLLCRLRADVHRCERMSRSQPFTLRMVVEPVDISKLVGEVEADLKRLSDGA